jgi:hypothetical protein
MGINMQPKINEDTQLRQYTLVKQQIDDALHAGFQYFEEIKAEQVAGQFCSGLSCIWHNWL